MKNQYNNSLVVLIAGSSTRFSADGKVKKQFLLIQDKPLFVHTLENLTKLSIFSSVVVVCQKEYLEHVNAYIEKYLANINAKMVHLIIGGSDRVESVYNAMQFLNDSSNNIDYVFVHDGVRPVVSEDEIMLLSESVIKHEAAILAIKMTDTVKQIDENGMIKQTLDRNMLYRAATPQAFLFSKYYNAISKCIDEKQTALITDDAQIYSMYQGDVAIVPCSSKNIKITTEDDISLIF